MLRLIVEKPYRYEVDEDLKLLTLAAFCLIVYFALFTLTLYKVHDRLRAYKGMLKQVGKENILNSIKCSDIEVKTDECK